MCTDTFRATHPLPEDDVGGVKLTEDVDDQFDREVLDTASWEETDSSPCVDYFYDSLVSVGTAHGCTARAGRADGASSDGGREEAGIAEYSRLGDATKCRCDRSGCDAI